MKKKKQNRILGLDGLRTIALIGVLLYHTFPSYIPGGFFGVILFFVLTGYLAAITMQKNYDGTFKSILKYYKKRIKRIYPELIIVIFTTIGILFLIDKTYLINADQETASILLGYNNYWQLMMNADYFTKLTDNSPFTHFWYIAIQLQFELIWPILYASFMKIKKDKGIGMMLITVTLLTLILALVMPLRALLGTSATILYYDTFCRFYAILAGVLLGLMHVEKLHFAFLHSRNGVKEFIYGIIFISISILLFLQAKGSDMWVYYIGMFLYTLLCVSMIEVISKRNVMAKLLDLPFFQLISKYSYEIYLWQYPILFIFGILKFTGTWYSYLLQILLFILFSIWLQNVIPTVSCFIQEFRTKKQVL